MYKSKHSGRERERERACIESCSENGRSLQKVIDEWSFRLTRKRKLSSGLLGENCSLLHPCTLNYLTRMQRD